MATPEEFYDALASEYHLLFDDWWSAALEHGRVIADVLAQRGILAGRLLDCTCGIGTQAIPLASLGYAVTATDVSSAAIDRARAEAAGRGIDVDFTVCDVRDVRDHVEGSFDVAISCDNALPHLLTDEHLEAALRSVRACLRPAGLLLVSLRDYDALRRSRPDGVPIAIHGEVGSRHGSSQAWQWSPDAAYVDIELFILSEEATGSWRARSGRTRYRALLRAELESLLLGVGFTEVEWRTPDVTGYYQPIVLARA